MKTLSVQQPWASLLAEQVKPIELRGWSTKFRGEVLIRASKNALPWVDDNGKRVKLPTNCLLFVGQLVSVKPMIPEDRIPAMSVYWNEEHSWVIEPCYYVKPIPAAGKLKLYETPDKLIERLPEADIRTYHPQLKLRTRHPFKATVIDTELLVVDSRSGLQTYYTTHLSNKPSLAWVQVPMFGYVGGVQGGTTPITWQEVAEVINAGKCYLRVEDLPQR